MAVRGQVAQSGHGWPTHLPGLMGPAFAAVVVTLGWQGTGALRDLGRRAVRWRGVGRWWWSVPAVLALGAVGLAVAAATGTPVDLGDLGGLLESTGPRSSPCCAPGLPAARRRLRPGARLARPARRRARRPGRRGAHRPGRHRRVGRVDPAAVLGRRRPASAAPGHDHRRAGAPGRVGRADPALRRLGTQCAARGSLAHGVRPRDRHHVLPEGSRRRSPPWPSSSPLPWCSRTEERDRAARAAALRRRRDAARRLAEYHTADHHGADPDDAYARRATQSSSAGQRPAHWEETIS